MDSTIFESPTTAATAPAPTPTPTPAPTPTPTPAPQSRKARKASRSAEEQARIDVANARALSLNPAASKRHASLASDTKLMAMRERDERDGADYQEWLASVRVETYAALDGAECAMLVTPLAGTRRGTRCYITGVATVLSAGKPREIALRGCATIPNLTAAELKGTTIPIKLTAEKGADGTYRCARGVSCGLASNGLRAEINTKVTAGRKGLFAIEAL